MAKLYIPSRVYSVTGGLMVLTAVCWLLGIAIQSLRYEGWGVVWDWTWEWRLMMDNGWAYTAIFVLSLLGLWLMEKRR